MVAISLRMQDFAEICERELVAAESCLARMDALDRERRPLLASNSPALATVAGVQGLLDRARSMRRVSVSEAAGWAGLAHDAAQRMAGPLADDCVTEALAEVGNVERIRGHLVDARETLAESLARLSETADPLIHCRVWSYVSSLQLTMGRWDSAIGWSRRAVALASRLRDHQLTLNGYLHLGHVYARAHQPAEALRVLGRALRMVESEGLEPLPGSDSFFILGHNILDAALEVCPERAYRWGMHLAPLMAGPRPTYGAYRSWTQAKALIFDKRLLEAEALLRQVYSDLEAVGSAWELAMVALDLVEVLVKMGGHLPEAQAVLDQLLDYYKGTDASPELLTCLTVLRTSVAQGLASVKVVAVIRRHFGGILC